MNTWDIRSPTIKVPMQGRSLEVPNIFEENNKPYENKFEKWFDGAFQNMINKKLSHSQTHPLRT